MYNNKLLFFVIGLICLVSCTNLQVYEQTETIKSAIWPAEKAYRFEYNSTDTVTIKDMYINFRHTGLYNYNNIYFFVTTIAPSGNSIKDTVEFTIADVKGKWAGSGIGDMYDLRLSFKKKIHFGQIGKYVLNIQHGMRDTKLKEVTDIGFRIQDSK